MKRYITYEGIKFRLVRRRTTVANICCNICHKCKLEQVYYESENLMQICSDCAEAFQYNSTEEKLQKRLEL